MVPTKPKAPGIAVSSLILGILGFFTCLLTSIPAIITGHIALSKIKQSAGLLGGRGMALTGTLLGYFSLVVIPIVAALTVPVVLRSVERAEEMTNLANAGVVHTALVSYAVEYNEFPPDLDSLVSSGHLSNPLALNYKSKSTITPWAYFPEARTEDYSSIILAGPVMEGAPRQRIIVLVDGSARVVDEAEAQRDAAAQGISLP